MFIRSHISNTEAHYTKYDRHVFTDQRLTDGAKVLYGYLAGLQNGARKNDKYIMIAMGISQAVLTKRKKELKETDLILVDRIAPREYVLYIGTTDVPASAMKKYWEEEEDTEENYRKWQQKYRRGGYR